MMRLSTITFPTYELHMSLHHTIHCTQVAVSTRSQSRSSEHDGLGSFLPHVIHVTVSGEVNLADIVA